MHPNQSLGMVCTLFGVTRQACYESEIQERKTRKHNKLKMKTSENQY
jgi:hypothetical protein